MRRCEYIERKTPIKNMLEFHKHFSSRSHHKLFFGPPCMYILFLPIAITNICAMSFKSSLYKISLYSKHIKRLATAESGYTHWKYLHMVLSFDAFSVLKTSRLQRWFNAILIIWLKYFLVNFIIFNYKLIDQILNKTLFVENILTR